MFVHWRDKVEQAEATCTQVGIAPSNMVADLWAWYKCNYVKRIKAYTNYKTSRSVTYFRWNARENAKKEQVKIPLVKTDVSLIDVTINKYNYWWVMHFKDMC